VGRELVVRGIEHEEHIGRNRMDDLLDRRGVHHATGRRVGRAAEDEACARGNRATSALAVAGAPGIELGRERQRAAQPTGKREDREGRVRHDEMVAFGQRHVAERADQLLATATEDDAIGRHAGAGGNGAGKSMRVRVRVAVEAADTGGQRCGDARRRRVRRFVEIQPMDAPTRSWPSSAPCRAAARVPSWSTRRDHRSPSSYAPPRRYGSTCPQVVGPVNRTEIGPLISYRQIGAAKRAHGRYHEGH